MDDGKKNDPGRGSALEDNDAKHVEEKKSVSSESVTNSEAKPTMSSAAPPAEEPSFYGDFPPGMSPMHGGDMFGAPQPSSLPDAEEKALREKKELTREEMFEWLKPVEDPELFMSVVELGLVYDVKLENGVMYIEMTLTSPGCPAGDYLVGSFQQRAEMHPLVERAEVKLVWEPKWDPYSMASEEAKDALGIW